MIRKRNSLAVSVIIKIFFLSLLYFANLFNTYSQTNQSQNKALDLPEGPITCEDWLVKIGKSVQEWEKNKDASLIIIAKFGNGESRRVNLKRIKTLKEYILNPRYKIKAIFAEGERTQDFGVVEFYVDGKLFYSIAVKQKQDIPLRFCN